MGWYVNVGVARCGVVVVVMVVLVVVMVVVAGNVGVKIKDDDDYANVMINSVNGVDGWGVILLSIEPFLNWVIVVALLFNSTHSI